MNLILLIAPLTLAFIGLLTKNYYDIKHLECLIADNKTEIARLQLANQMLSQSHENMQNIQFAINSLHKSGTEVATSQTGFYLGCLAIFAIVCYFGYTSLPTTAEISNIVQTKTADTVYKFSNIATDTDALNIKTIIENQNELHSALINVIMTNQNNLLETFQSVVLNDKTSSVINNTINENSVDLALRISEATPKLTSILDIMPK